MGSKSRIVFIGAAGTGLNIVEQVADACSNFNYPAVVEGILIDSFEKGTQLSGIQVIGALKDAGEFLRYPDIFFLFALFKPEKLRERYGLMKKLGIPQDRFANFLHPASYISRSIKTGIGNIILSNSVLQSNVCLGNFNTINTHITVEHDTKLGDGNFISAGAMIGSYVKIGNHCFIGLNSSVRENTKLGDDVFVGMNSAVLDNFNNTIIAGSPAKPLKK